MFGIAPRARENPLLSVRIFLGVIAFLAAACTLASLIPQREISAFYLHHYGPILGRLIVFAGLDRAYQAWWFVAAEAWLVLSMGACTWRRAMMWRRLGGAPARHRIAQLSLALAHLGVLLILATLILRPYTHRADYVNVAEGGIAGLARHAYPFDLYVRRFTVDVYPDGTPKQYTTLVEVRESGKIKRVARIAVNHPLRHRGTTVYQYNWGWLVRGTVTRAGATRLFEIPSGTAVDLAGGCSLHLHFYPDFALDAAGAPSSRSPLPRRPRVFYVLYRDGRPETFGLAAPGETASLPDGNLVVQGYKPYTGLQVKREPTLPLTFLGFGLTAAGLALYYTLRLTRAQNSTEG